MRSNDRKMIRKDEQTKLQSTMEESGEAGGEVVAAVRGQIMNSLLLVFTHQQSKLKEGYIPLLSRAINFSWFSSSL